MALEDRVRSAVFSPLRVVDEWQTSFGKKYERLSCGHSRRKEERGTEPDRTDRGGAGADSNLPLGEYCWHGCHEQPPTDMALRQDDEPYGANAMIAADPEDQPLR